MRTLLFRVGRRRHVVAAAVVTLASTASGQTKGPAVWQYGLAVGSPDAGLPIPGAGVVLARATWQPQKRLALRSEATVATVIAIGGDAVGVACPIDSPCLRSPPKPTSVVGMSGHVILNDNYIVRNDRGTYYVLGGGMYRALSPSSVGSIGGAMEGGFGLKFGGVSLEAKVVYIRHWIGGDSGLIPVTLGYTW